MMMGQYTFKVRATATAQTLPRLMNYFAQRDLMPCKVAAEIDDLMMTIVIEQDDIAAEAATIIAEKMRSMVLVESIDLNAKE